MVGREEEILQALAAEALKDLLHSVVIVVPFHKQCEEEAGIEEDQMASWHVRLVRREGAGYPRPA